MREACSMTKESQRVGSYGRKVLIRRSAAGTYLEIKPAPNEGANFINIIIAEEEFVSMVMDVFDD
jgi:hypothetical protein